MMHAGSVLSSAYHVFDMLVLSTTSHARLTLATEPADYDMILKQTVREVKFYSETLLAILFFAESPALLSQTLACLMFSLIIYILTEAMTGESLHRRLDEIPCSRIILACMTKLPALTVLWTLSALALSQWDSLATKMVLCTVAGILLLGFLASLGVVTLVKRVWIKVCKGIDEGAKRVSNITEVRRKRKLSDASVASDGTVVDEGSAGKDGSSKSSGGERV